VEVAVMIWLFHRGGEVLSCETRTCVEDEGFEILIARHGRVKREWCADEQQLSRRWHALSRELRRDGWGEMHQRR
jgi:hypothetical protein